MIREKEIQRIKPYRIEPQSGLEQQVLFTMSSFLGDEADLMWDEYSKEFTKFENTSNYEPENFYKARAGYVFYRFNQLLEYKDGDWEN